MSSSRQRARDLLSDYHGSLEQQIVDQGSGLPCRDEALQRKVEELLMDGDAQETHCLGLDPLRVMEESLEAAGGRRVQLRGGLRGLAKSFEVLEQAALNLHLGPWREEYKVIKMHSGTFTHFIAPVLSRPHIESLFNLLGYQSSPSQPEQLRLHPPTISPACQDDLLRLACAFFVARCECRLLLTALGRHSSDTLWELSVVRERRRGSSLQVALDNAKKTLVEQFEDLYTDDMNGGQQQQQLVEDDEGSGAAPPAVNGVMSPQLKLEISKKLGSEETDSQVMELSTSPPEAGQPCVCHQSAHCYVQRCLQCDTLHDISCSFVEACRMNDHTVKFLGGDPDMPPPSLHDGPKALAPSLDPISYHECCDPSRLDPRILCFNCAVFHSGSCRDLDLCSRNHHTKKLGQCSCGKHCSRKPLVLCRYCGNEYCNSCWYRNPVSCSCGQTFDQSTSV